MRRRIVIFSLTAAVVGGLSGCATREPDATATATPSATPGATASVAATEASTTPILASTAHSSLAPQTVTPYVPPAGQAPAQVFAVGRRDFSFSRGQDRPLPVRVWYPANGAAGGDAVDNAEPAPGQFPVVLFSHGLNSAPADFNDMLARWAQAGFIVAAPTYPHTSYGAADFDETDIINQPADASYVLTELLAAADPLTEHLDPNRLGAAGHSGGGITTVGLFSGRRDTRLTAAVVLAGTDFGSTPFSGPAAAMMFVHGKKDKSVTYKAGQTVFNAVPWSRALLTVTNGAHSTTGAEFEAVTGTSTDFLRWSLYGDAAAKSRLPAKAAVNDVATLDDQL